MKLKSKNPDETILIGQKLARELGRGSVVALIGDLGSGKTVLTKGLAKGLGVKNSRYVNSPTFVIIKEYKGKIPLYHFDLYRLNHSSLLDMENFEEYFYGDGVTVIEWADKIRAHLPPKHVEIKMKVIGEGEREIKIDNFK
ncbi:MAG TPA: tRNA (adenosine(37)-N6)-threonylcarbamoyltransferase complex ATPase subunit type 1 TsaE [Candidatus Omnitrophota bacterium]|nr:tRNA (adenosine(37)-N6)-threonylcarbamoyltransferase complex ATPase subunit type 1 TsaE [Candidatus Omnitrophota bacterium]